MEMFSVKGTELLLGGVIAESHTMVELTATKFTRWTMD